MPLARISLTLSRHFSLSFIASGRSSGLHPISSHCCCMYVQAGRPAFARPYVRVHRSTSLMSSSLVLQQCPACLIRLTWIVFVMGGRWPYSWCLGGCCPPGLVQYCLQHSCVIIFTQPLRSGMIWQKDNFYGKFNRFCIQSFSSPRLVASPRLKNLVCPTIYP